MTNSSLSNDTPVSIFDAIGDHHCPWFYSDYIDSKKSDIVFAESARQAYGYKMAVQIIMLDVTDYEMAEFTLRNIYKEYVDDNYESRFWTDFLPRILNNPKNSILTYTYGHVYFDGKEIKL